MVLHTCNPGYLGGRDRRILVKDHPREKVSDSLKNKPDMIAYACGSSYFRSRGRRIVRSA
jgi:hypothetical protein